MKYYDKSYYSEMKKCNNEKATKCVNNKRKELINLCWLDYPAEGGIVSPDLSTMFMYDRSPLYGQYVMFSNLMKDDYLKLVRDNGAQFEIKEVDEK